MWPLDRLAGGDVMRVGAHAVELWRRRGGSMEQVAHEPLPRRGSLYDVSALKDSLRAIAGRAGSGRMTVVIESAYAPVLLANTGGMLTRAGQVDALFRHRFGLAYGSPERDVAQWRVRWTHRYGDCHALGYGLDPHVEAVLREGVSATGLAFVAWVPALSWGLEHFGRRRRAARCPWWVWTEQDRSLAVHLRGSQVDTLDPAMLDRGTVADVERAVDAAATRVTGSIAGNVGSPIGVGHWHVTEAPRGQFARVRQFAVAGDASSSQAATESARALSESSA